MRRAMPVHRLQHRELGLRRGGARASDGGRAQWVVVHKIEGLSSSQSCPGLAPAEHALARVHVEWVNVVAAAQRIERPSVANLPLPATPTEKDCARRPPAATRRPGGFGVPANYLGSHCSIKAISARPQCRDVRFTTHDLPSPLPTPQAEDRYWFAHYGVVLNIRRGKGARFRGPHAVPYVAPPGVDLGSYRTGGRRRGV